MTEVFSLQGDVKLTGVDKAVDGFEQLARAIKAAETAKRTSQDKGFYADQRMQATAMREMNKEFENRRKAALTMFPAFEKAKTSVGQWASANAGLLSSVGAVAGVVYGAGKAAAASYMEFQNYAGSVRDLSAISGTGAEETSRFIQVLDDFEISAEDVTTATKAMTKQGLAPTVETLAKLSDEYKKIQNPMERNAFVLKNLGKGGLAWTNALSQGGDALRDMSKEVDKNLILNEKQKGDSETSRLAIDALSDKWKGMKVAVGAAIGGVIASNKAAKDAAVVWSEYAASAGLSGKALVATGSRFERFKKQIEKGAAMTVFYTQLEKDLAVANHTVIRSEEELIARRGTEISVAYQSIKVLEQHKAQKEAIAVSLTTEQAKLEKLNQGYYTYAGANQTVNQELQKVTSSINTFAVGVSGTEQDLAKLTKQQQELSGMLAGEEQVHTKNTTAIKQQEAVVRQLQAAQKEADDAFIAAQKQKLLEISLSSIAMRDGAEGFSQSERDAAQALLETQSASAKAAFQIALNQQDIADAIESDSIPSAQQLKRILDLMAQGYSISVALEIDMANLKALQSELNTMTGGIAGQFGGAIGDDVLPTVTKPNKPKGTGGGAGGGGFDPDDRASGGQLGSGWTLVGDRPGGGFVNGVSELISPSGYVYDAKTSKQLMDSGVLGQVTSRAEAGDLGGGMAVSTSPISKKTNIASTFYRPIPGSGGAANNSMNVGAASIVESNQATAQQTAQQTAAMQQQMTQYITQQMATVQNGFEMLAGVLVNDNPRAIGASVSTEFAKLS